MCVVCHKLRHSFCVSETAVAWVCIKNPQMVDIDISRVSPWGTLGQEVAVWVWVWLRASARVSQRPLGLGLLCVTGFGGPFSQLGVD
jgi:hypothetical protein